MSDDDRRMVPLRELLDDPRPKRPVRADRGVSPAAGLVLMVAMTLLLALIVTWVLFA